MLLLSLSASFSSWMGLAGTELGFSSLSKGFGIAITYSQKTIPKMQYYLTDDNVQALNNTESTRLLSFSSNLPFAFNDTGVHTVDIAYSKFNDLLNVYVDNQVSICNMYITDDDNDALR